MNRKMILYLKAMTIFFMSITKERVIKANRLAYIAEVWNMGRISADCQQSLFSLKHNIREIFFTTNFSLRTGERTWHVSC